MKTPIALSMLLSPFSLPHDERWGCPSRSAFSRCWLFHMAAENGGGRQVAL